MKYEIVTKFDDNSSQAIELAEIIRAVTLEEIGLLVEGYAVQNAPVGTPESTGIEGYHGGFLRQSITHAVVGDTVHIGTNLKGAPSKDYPKGVPYPA